MRYQTATSAKTASILFGAGATALALSGSISVSECLAQAAPPQPGSIYLRGLVRDFLPGHPDFGVNNPPDLGHNVRNVAPQLDPSGRPMFTGGGVNVTGPWYDKDGNIIRPYGDPGLPGGHFDVDVFDAPVDEKLYHQHKFDDLYDVTYIDIANDPNLLFDSVIGAGYPNDLRVTMNNVANGGGGSFTFEAGAGVQTGVTADGFTAVFSPSQLAQFRINFVALGFLAKTEPKLSQQDIAGRAGALSVRMYDVVTDAMVYEITAYHHFKEDEVIADMPILPKEGIDACGVPFNDSVGTFGAGGDGAITGSGTFDQWFRNDPTTNVSMPHGITMELDDQGIYTFTSNSFYPADNQMYGNGGSTHNNFFTYTISTTFVYHACTDQFIEFEGNDDAWVFINGELVLDLGGVTNGTRQYVALDRLNLVDGEIYPLDLFYAHRRETTDSLFTFRTNIQLHSTVALVASNLYD